MEDLLHLYAEPFHPFDPVVCFDERPYQLLADVTEPIPAKPGHLTRTDDEYSRQGTGNLFVFFAPHYGWRHVEVTPSRTKLDFAHQMEALVDIHFPSAYQIRVVLDNLNTSHSCGVVRNILAPESEKNS